MAASDRIYSLVNEQVDLLDPENPVPISDIKGEIEFKNVYFGYILEDPNKKNASSGRSFRNGQKHPNKTCLGQCKIIPPEVLPMFQ